MKVLYFHQHFSTPEGSTGTRSYEFSRRLLKAGHEVTMVCGSYSGGKTGLHGPFQRGQRVGVVDGIEIIELKLNYSNRDGFLKRTWIFLLFAIRSIWIALTKKYDLVFATTTPLTAGIPGIFAKWLRRKPFVFEVRDLWPELPKAMGVIRNPLVLGGMSLLEWISYRSADRLIGLSPGIVQGIHKRGVAGERIAMIPNGCDLELFANVGAAWRPVDVSPDDLLAIYTGTHGIANGLDAVLDAAAELKRRNVTQIKIVLVGDGKLKGELRQRATAEHLDNVFFLDPVGKSQLAGLMAGADLGMQILKNVPAFYYGTSPNKFFDYLSAGLPVLVNYPGWVAEMVVEHDCGFAVPGDDPVAFANALENAFAVKSYLRTKGKNGQDLAAREFDRNALGEQFVAWLKNR
jgi:glycosyltransferase involved in cell wall biosynthesis